MLASNTKNSPATDRNNCAEENAERDFCVDMSLHVEKVIRVPKGIHVGKGIRLQKGIDVHRGIHAEKGLHSVQRRMVQGNALSL